MNQLTEKQKDVLNEIASFHTTNGYMPTVREIGKICGHSSTNLTRTYLKALEKKKEIKKIPKIARGIVLLNDVWL